MSIKTINKIQCVFHSSNKEVLTNCTAFEKLLLYSPEAIEPTLITTQIDNLQPFKQLLTQKKQQRHKNK